MNREKYLPIGTVVLLKEAEKRIMIIGFEADSNGKHFDYFGCLFPEGMQKSNKKLVFNHEQIKLIYYLGYFDEESKKYHQTLNM